MSLTPSQSDLVDRIIALEKQMRGIFSGQAGLRPDPRFVHPCEGGSGECPVSVVRLTVPVAFSARMPNPAYAEEVEGEGDPEGDPEVLGYNYLDFVFVPGAFYIAGIVHPHTVEPPLHGWQGPIPQVPDEIGAGQHSTWDVGNFHLGIEGPPYYRVINAYLPAELQAKIEEVAGADFPDNEYDFASVGGAVSGDIYVQLGIVRTAANRLALQLLLLTPELEVAFDDVPEVVLDPPVIFDPHAIPVFGDVESLDDLWSVTEMIAERFPQVVEAPAASWPDPYYGHISDGAGHHFVGYKRYGPRMELATTWYFGAGLENGIYLGSPGQTHRGVEDDEVTAPAGAEPSEVWPVDEAIDDYGNAGVVPDGWVAPPDNSRFEWTSYHELVLDQIDVFEYWAHFTDFDPETPGNFREISLVAWSRTQPPGIGTNIAGYRPMELMADGTLTLGAWVDAEPSASGDLASVMPFGRWAHWDGEGEATVP